MPLDAPPLGEVVTNPPPSTPSPPPTQPQHPQGGLLQRWEGRGGGRGGGDGEGFFLFGFLFLGGGGGGGGELGGGGRGGGLCYRASVKPGSLQNPADSIGFMVLVTGTQLHDFEQLP